MGKRAWKVDDNMAKSFAFPSRVIKTRLAAVRESAGSTALLHVQLLPPTLLRPDEALIATFTAISTSLTSLPDMFHRPCLCGVSTLSLYFPVLPAAPVSSAAFHFQKGY